MGLFDKKFCDICGNKIGLLGNKKLADGNMCGECEKKLSVWFKDRKNSTVEQIKAQLADRELNQQALSSFSPTRQIGTDSDKFFLVDEKMGRFIVLCEGEDMKKNPDLLELSRVRNARLEINEEKSEVKYQDANGNYVSFNPKHYSYKYKFNIIIDYDGKYFDTVQFPISYASINGGKDSDEYVGQVATGSLADSISGQFLDALGLGSSPSNVTTVKVDSFGRRLDLPGGYRDDGLTTMTDINIQRYREYRSVGEEIVNCLMPRRQKSEAELLAEANRLAIAVEAKMAAGGFAPTKGNMSAPVEGWNCSYCGAENSGKFCKECGAPRP